VLFLLLPAASPFPILTPSRVRRAAILALAVRAFMIITIDGPAGAGKSSAAHALAQRLGFEFLDTGAMFRAVALDLLRRHTDLTDERALVGVLEGLRLELPPGQVLLNGEDVTAQIRTPEVTALSSAVAVLGPVRHRLAALQRQLATGRDLVCEGRDQGTAVFPDAVCKFFLVADPAERARRRFCELRTRGLAADLESIRASIEERDRRDAGRDIAPMIPADDAVLIDSTSLTSLEVLDRMLEEVQRRMGRR
jgi:cytidylate kinase